MSKLQCMSYIYTQLIVGYSLPEMAGGWGGPLMKKEDEFLVLDGM